MTRIPPLMFVAFRVGRRLMEVESACPRLFSNRGIRRVWRLRAVAFVCIAVVAGGFGIGFSGGDTEARAFHRPSGAGFVLDSPVADATPVVDTTG